MSLPRPPVGAEGTSKLQSCPS